MVGEYEEKKLHREEVRNDGREQTRKTVGDDKLLNVASIAANSVTQAMMTNNSIGQAQWRYETVTVTVSAGTSSKTATVTSGDIVIGYYPSVNQDQFVKSIAIVSTTLTLTLLANATADNTFVIVLLKT